MAGRQIKGWPNKRIWGDNKLILSSLKSGALRRQIEYAGGLKLIYIDPPFEVGADFSMDIEIGGETFHKEPNLFKQIAYVEVTPRYDGKNKLALSIEHTDFSVHYSQDLVDSITAELKAGKSEVACDAGQLVKFSIDKDGIVDAASGEFLEFEERWTGACIFENKWQSFSTRRDRYLELTSATQTYAQPGRYTVAIKVIDIFGNDTMTLVPMSVG